MTDSLNRNQVSASKNPDAAAQKAQEIAAKLSQTLTGSSSSGQSWQSPGLVASGQESFDIMVPVEKVGLVIGRGGSTIRELQETSGAKLELASSGEPSRLLRILGSAQSVEIAKSKIQGLLSQRTFVGKVPAKPVKTLQIPSDCVGFVIGKGGDTIRRISQETGCRLQVENEEQARNSGNDPPMMGHQYLHLSGSEESVNNAERQVTELIQSKNRAGNSSGAGYGLYYQQAHALRAQPYPTYSLNPGYPQVVQQMYTLPQNTLPGYPQMQGYGGYTPQAANVCTGYPAQLTQQQATPGYPQQYTSISPPQNFQSQQPAPLAHQQGLSQNPLVSQVQLQGYPNNSQQQVMGAIQTSQQVAPAGNQQSIQSTDHAGMKSMPQGEYVRTSQSSMNQTDNVDQRSNAVGACNSTAFQQYQSNLADSRAP